MASRGNSRAAAKYDYLIKLLLIGDSGNAAQFKKLSYIFYRNSF